MLPMLYPLKSMEFFCARIRIGLMIDNTEVQFLIASMHNSHRTKIYTNKLIDQIHGYKMCKNQVQPALRKM